MRPGNRIIFVFIFLSLTIDFSIAEEKITSSPLINVDEITPSFEELEEENENISLHQNLKEKKKLQH